MSEFFSAIITYPFMLRALIVGLLISGCCSVLGVPLVLKRYSMIGDGLSHVAFGAIALASALGFAPMIFTIPVVIITAFLLLRLNDKGKIKGDAATALISVGALAVGVMAVSLSQGMNADVYNYMFGSVLSMSESDVNLSIVLSLSVIILFLCFYNKIFGITFDEDFHTAGGMKTSAYNMLLSFLTAITVVLGMRVMGALLISALLIFPTITSLKLFKTFKGVVLSAVSISFLSFIIGFYASYSFDAPTGATIVIVNIILFLIACFINCFKK